MTRWAAELIIQSSINDVPSPLYKMNLPPSYKNQRTNKEVFLFIDNRINPSCSIDRSIEERSTAPVDLKKLGQL